MTIIAHPGTPCPPLLGDWTFPTALVIADRDGIVHVEGSVDTDFPFASVTKPIATYAALIAVDRHMFDLDAPAGPHAPEGATIRHLMAHASGLPFERDYVAQRPERHRVYSNVGIEVMGERFEEETGISIQEYTDEQVLTPLGLTHLMFDGSPAYGAHGTVRDLADLIREWLAPTLVSPALFKEATTPQFPDLDGVLPSYGRQRPNEWGLGFEIRGHKDPHWTSPLHSPRTFGHFGQAGSFIWVDPDVGLGAAFLGAEPYGAEHRKKWTDLNGRIYTCAGRHRHGYVGQRPGDMAADRGN
ncbi:MAG: serine hydrolase domain-containing protein [Bowdeniella nasicola]|nr:serine hydrolase domain-containing protein [Bowdeniella nasicola]